MKLSLIGLIALSAFAFVSCNETPGVENAAADTQTSPSPVAVEPQTVKECPLSFPKLGLCASLAWEQEPTDEEMGEFTLRFWNAQDSSISGPFIDPTYPVTVKLWMPSMGHGSSPVKVAQAKSEDGKAMVGTYRATDVHFVMGGEWEIWVEFKKDKKLVEHAKIDYAL